MKAAIKRNVRGYKIADKPYEKAMKRADRNNGNLSNLIENVVIAYANGYDIQFVKMNGKMSDVVIPFEFSEKQLNKKQ